MIYFVNSIHTMCIPIYYVSKLNILMISYKYKHVIKAVLNIQLYHIGVREFEYYKSHIIRYNL